MQRHSLRIVRPSERAVNPDDSEINAQEPPSPSARVLLVLPEVFNCVGGIQMFGRSLCLAASRWAHAHNGSVSVLVLNDSDEPDPRYVNGFTSFQGLKKNKSKLIGQFL